MNILRILARSFSEAFQFTRILPFFLLYLIPLLAGSVFIIPILKLSPSIFTLEISETVLGEVAIYLIPIIIASIIVFFANLWFVGALVHNIQTGENFSPSLKYSSSIYWHLLAFSLLAIFFSLLIYFVQLGIIFKIIFDILLFVSIPAIVKEKNLLKGIKSNFSLVKKRPLQTTLMWILVGVLNIILLFTLLFSITFIFSPLLTKIFVANPVLNTAETFSTEQYVQLVGFILNNYHYVFLTCVITAFFFSVITVFSYTSNTYFFLSISKKNFKFS